MPEPLLDDARPLPPVSRWVRWVDVVAPPPADEAVAFRHRFTVVACTLAALTGVVTGALFTLFQDTTAGGIIWLYAALSLLPLLALRHGARPDGVFWFQQLTTVVAFSLLDWVTSPRDWTIAMWLSVLPLTAMLFAGLRVGLVAAGLATVTFVVMLLGPPPGLPFHPTPSAFLSSLARLFSFLGATSLIALIFDALRRGAIRRAQDAAQARTLFLANVSHELRTPLNGVVGLTDLLLASSPRDDQREHLHLLQGSAQALIALINDLLDFTKLDTGRLRLEHIPFDLHGLVADLRQLFEPAAERAGLSLEVTMASDVPRYLLGDPVRVRQVLTNLLSNAVKFTPQGRLDLTLRRNGPRLEATMRDTGIGMDDATLARLFAPFEQADASFTRRFGGTGLGLAISRQLAQRMGGDLVAMSTAGQGSMFIFSFPLEESSAPTPEVASSAAPVPQRVLVVDDNAVNRLVAVELLKRAGCETRVANNGREALELLTRERVDAVLMDCQMPELDGFETTRAIRALPTPMSEVPVIAMTASALPEQVARCRAAGMNGCVTKPVTLDMLLGALSSCGARPPETAAPRAASMTGGDEGGSVSA